MTIRKFSRDDLEFEPHGVRFKDHYDLGETPFGASLAIVEPGGRTMLHGHDPAETFFICRGHGTMQIDGVTGDVGPGDVVYLKPHCVHDLRNDSTTEELVFVSVFWNPTPSATLDPTPRWIMPAPPTPNGPLHLGHLAGPYLLADALRRYYRVRGVPATLALIIDEHQSYVADRAAHDGCEPGELATKYGDAIVQTFERFGATPDLCVFPARDAAYRATVQARFAMLHATGKLSAREVQAPYCETCAMWLYDSYIAGGCPACGARSHGFSCDACCSLVDPAKLVDAECDRCHAKPVLRATTRLVFPIAPYVERLADYHRPLRLAPRLRRLAAQWVDPSRRDHVVPASQASTWGIPVGIAGFEGQVISPWFEIALASIGLREQHAPTAHTVCCFGCDNAFLYLVHDPAIALALDPAAALPVALASNEFLLLDDAKMSTSRSHTLDATAVLAKAPPDLVRLYLAKIRPEDAPTSSNIQGATMYVNFVARYWQDWLERLARALIDETGSLVPAAANPSLIPWSQEQNQFVAQLKSLGQRARAGYEDMSLREVSVALHELVERATAFGTAQRHLAGIASLATQRTTGLALECAAARTLAVIASPLMPAFATALWRCLGYTGPVEWLDDVAPVPDGQRVATDELVARRLWPAWIEL